MVIKYSSDGEVEWATSIGGDDREEITSVSEMKDGGYVVGGSFGSESIKIGDYTLTNASRENGMLVLLDAEFGVPEQQEVFVQNELKTFKITTEVEEIDGVKGGNISGEDERTYL